MLDAAELQPGSFVDDALKDRHADLLYAVPWQAEAEGAEGPPALLYVLFEHQSTVDALMPLRLLRYMVRIWERWRAEHLDAVALPAILLVVLYHGPGPWTAATRFERLLEMPDAVRHLIAPHTPAFELVLQDLPRMSDGTLGAGSLDAVARLLFKHIRQVDLAERLEAWADRIRAFVAEAAGDLQGLALVVEDVLEVNEDVAPTTLAGILAATSATKPGRSP